VIALCHLPSLSFAQLRSAFPLPHTVSNVGSWDALLAQLDHRGHDVIVVDPCRGDERLAASRLRSLAAAIACSPPNAVVGYVSVTAAAVRAVHALARIGATEIVIRGVDDAPGALGAAVRRAVATRSATTLVDSVSGELATLPVAIANALVLMFRNPDRVRSVATLAEAANTTRRSLDRWLARAGLAPARTLLACARTNAAFHLLAAGQVPRSRAAAAIGYASPRSLARELFAVSGYSASAIRSGVSRQAFEETVKRRLVRSAARSSAAAASY
jgi:AraC-like DNA-binding protein